MKRRMQIDCKLSGLSSRAKLVLILIALATLWASALAQEETAEDWSKKGKELRMNGSLEEALGALDKAITLDSGNTDAWQYKALTLRDLERFNESLEAFKRALELNPQNDQAKTEIGWAAHGHGKEQ